MTIGGTVTIGDEVFTRDGTHLGAVKELNGETHFKVDAPRARDYWLACDVLVDVTGRRLTVDFDASELDAYQLEQPTAAAADPRIDAATRDGLSESERREQQEEMKSGYPSAVAPPQDSRSGHRSQSAADASSNTEIER